MKRYILLAALLLLGGCAQNAPEGKQAEEPSLEKITVVLDWVPNTNHTGMYLARDLGYYKEAGLAVDIIQPPEDGAEALTASGKADFGVSFQETLAFALEADEPLPLTAVAAILQHNTSGILSLKEKGIESPKAMAGKRYATWDLPVEQAVLKDVIEGDGGAFSDVVMIPSTVTDVLTALQTDIDAVWVYYGWDGIAAKVKGLDANYFEFRGLNPVLDFYTPILVAGNDFLEKRPGAAEKFLAATARGYAYAVENPEAAADCLVKNAPEVDPDIALESQRYLAGEYIAEAPCWGYIDPKRWSGFYDWLYEKEITRTSLGEQGFTNGFLQEF